MAKKNKITELLPFLSTIRLNSTDLSKDSYFLDIDIKIIKTSDNPVRWAVENMGNVLTKQKNGKYQFAYSPLPSNRPDDYFEYARFSSFKLALSEALKIRTEIIQDKMERCKAVVDKYESDNNNVENLKRYTNVLQTLDDELARDFSILNEIE